MSIQCLLPLLLMAASSVFAQSELRESIRAKAEQLYPDLEPIYKDFHFHPELSGKEERTSERLAEQPGRLGEPR